MNTFITLILIYILSIPLAMYSNKLAFKKANAEICPTYWIILVINTISVFFLLIGTFIVSERYSDSQYWKEKWDKNENSTT